MAVVSMTDFSRTVIPAYTVRTSRGVMVGSTDNTVCLVKYGWQGMSY